jgi:branched-chain amino acid transport system permease protein
MNRPSALERLWPLVALAAVLLVVTSIFSQLSPALNRTVITMLINLVVVLGLYVFIGNSGIFSFGHTAFMAVGAYVTGLLTIPVETKRFLFPDLPLLHAHVSPGLAVLIGALSAMVLAALVGVPIARMNPLAASLATFAVLAVVFNVGQNWQDIGGSSGLSEVPIVITQWTALAWAGVALVIAFCYQQSRWGLRLRATREDEVAARSVGVHVGRERFVSLVISAFIVGIGGGVLALNLGFFTPNLFYVGTAFVTLVMLLFGGMTSLSGAVVGTIVISAIQELLKHVEEGVSIGPIRISGLEGIENIVLSALLITIMIWRPLGLTQGREVPWPFRRGTTPSPPMVPQSHATTPGPTAAAADPEP